MVNFSSKFPLNKIEVVFQLKGPTKTHPMVRASSPGSGWTPSMRSWRRIHFRPDLCWFDQCFLTHKSALIRMDADASSELTSYGHVSAAVALCREALNFKGTQIRLAMGKTGGYDARAPLEWLLVNLPKQERGVQEKIRNIYLPCMAEKRKKLHKYIQTKQKFHSKMGNCKCKIIIFSTIRIHLGNCPCFHIYKIQGEMPI